MNDKVFLLFKKKMTPTDVSREFCPTARGTEVNQSVPTHPRPRDTEYYAWATEGQKPWLQFYSLEYLQYDSVQIDFG